MRTYKLLLILTLIFSITSCKLCKKNDSTVNNDKLTNEVSDIIMQRGFVKPENSASIEILKTSIEGNILTIEVSYNGGCAEH